MATEPIETTGEQAEPTPVEPHGTDWKAEARKWEERSKANRAELDELAEQLKQLRGEQSKQTDAADRAAKAEAEVERIKAELDRTKLVNRIASETGVPASLLTGEDEAALKASADAINAFAASKSPAYPSDKGSGSSTAPVTVDAIESIKDPVARIRARAEHIDLYN